MIYTLILYFKHGNHEYVDNGTGKRQTCYQWWESWSCNRGKYN